MPGSVAPHADNYAVVVSEKMVADADCGLDSHEASTLEQPVADLARRSDAGWEPLTAHRSVLVPHGATHDANGKPMRGRIIRHELTYRRAPSQWGWLYRIDALSDPEDPQVEAMIAVRINEGWTLAGCSPVQLRSRHPQRRPRRPGASHGGRRADLEAVPQAQRTPGSRLVALNPAPNQPVNAGATFTRPERLPGERWSSGGCSWCHPACR
jgi:hypothetical protein